ncbi:MerR family transcriptional regulator [Micromonospora sp. NPDC126480]|uniref:MerR family transcriptional regulator n=1 Tax=Micromonospora sp. NPDC126480 TaxID=3155312 RepID=UPI00331D97D5
MRGDPFGAGSPHRGGPAAGRLMQIGEAADRVGLSIRTIRHYEDAGLIVPSARSEGGFRLYTDADLDRLAVVKRMKPLGFTLDEMRDLLGVLDGLPTAGEDERPALLDRLGMFHTIAAARVDALREQLATAEGFADTLRHHLGRHASDRRSAGQDDPSVRGPR